MRNGIVRESANAKARKRVF